MDENWDCEAYGPEGTDTGALCFFADPGTRNCRSQNECAASVTGARQMIFNRIQQAAAGGDPAAIGLAKEFTSPDQLLSRPGTTGPADQRTGHP